MNARIFFYLKLAVTVVLLGSLFWRIDLLGLARSLALFRYPIWLTNIGLYMLACGIAALKWKTLLPQHSVGTLLRLNFIGSFYSTLLPGQIAGEVVKAYKLGRGRPDAGEIAASVIIDRVTGFIGLLIIALVGLVLSPAAVDRSVLWAFGVFAVVLITGLFCLNLSPWFRLLHNSAGLLGKFSGSVRQSLEASRRYANRFGLLLLASMLGACFQLTAVLMNFRFARELGIGVSFADWCWIFGIVSVVTMLPLTIAGLGLREGSFVGVLGLFKVSPEKAIAVSLAMFGLMLVGAAIGALFDWTGDHKSVRR